MPTPPAWKGVFDPTLRESDLPVSSVSPTHGGSAHHNENHEVRHVSGGADAFTTTDLLEALVKRVRESGGADLVLGAIADGQFLKRSGTGIIGDAPTATVNVKETEVDWGTAAYQTDKTFTVVDGDVGAGSQLLCQVAHKSPSDGRSVDEIVVESFDLKAKVAVGSFDLTMKSLHGPVTGRFLVNYLVG